MIDIRGSDSSGKVEVGRIALKRSGEEGGGILVDLDLVQDIGSEDEAKLIDLAVPGALRLWQASSLARKAGEVETEVGGAAAGSQAAGASGTFGQIAIRPPDVPIRMNLGDGDARCEGDVEVRGARVKATPKACAYTVKVRMAGLDTTEIARLVDLLGEVASVTFVARQGVLPFRGKRAAIEVGEVVSGVNDGTEYAGVVLSVVSDDGTESIEVDDCGTVYIVPTATIAGSFAVEGADGKDRAAMVDVFVKACRKAKTKASWTHLVAALGRAYLAGDEGAPEGAWPLLPSIVEDAVESTRRARKQLAVV